MTNWKQIPGYEDRYLVGDNGQILSLRRRIILTPGTNGKKGYLMVMLQPGHRKHYVHHLVAEAFLGPRPDGQIVRHLDGNLLNCTASNLSYGSRSDNELDKVRHGTHQMASKTECKRGHPYTNESSYWNGRQRVCRICRSENVAAFHKRNPTAAADYKRRWRANRTN